MHSTRTLAARHEPRLATPLLNLDKLAAAPLQRDPYDYLVVPGFLDQSVVEAINADYPKYPAPATRTMSTTIAVRLSMPLSPP